MLLIVAPLFSLLISPRTATDRQKMNEKGHGKQKGDKDRAEKKEVLFLRGLNARPSSVLLLALIRRLDDQFNMLAIRFTYRRSKPSTQFNLYRKNKVVE